MSTCASQSPQPRTRYASACVALRSGSEALERFQALAPTANPGNRRNKGRPHRAGLECDRPQRPDGLPGAAGTEDLIAWDREPLLRASAAAVQDNALIGHLKPAS